MADIFDVIADPTRRELLNLLLTVSTSGGGSRGEISVGEIVERTSLTQPTVSKHLKVLRDHGMVRVREKGQHRYYTLDAGPLEELETWVLPFLSSDFGDEAAPGIGSAEDAALAQPDSSRIGAVFAAWSGADAGQKVGRAVADRSFRAWSRIHDVQDELTRRILRITGR